MKKIFLIGWKDLTLVFRDGSALVLMLAAPLVLIFGLGFITGHFSGGQGSGIQDIPVILVNQDAEQLGNELVNVFNSNELADLVNPIVESDPIVARQRIDQNEAAAAVIIPQGFTASIIPQQGGTPTGPLEQIELYSNPTSPTSAGVIKTIVEGFISQVEVGRVGAEVIIFQLISRGVIQSSQVPIFAGQVGASQAAAAGQTSSIGINSSTNTRSSIKFDPLAYMAPGMALLFLMFTVTYGGRSLLVEQNQGTLPRLFVSPTSTFQVLGGKVVGIYLTGVAQMLILIIGCALIFNLQWGDPLGVLALVLAAVAAATGWGMLITAFTRTPGQVSAIGSAVMLIFGALGGSFFSLDNMPAYVKMASKITPNAWGVDGFTTLALGGGLRDVMVPVLALLGMGLVLFLIAVFFVNRRTFNRA